MRVKIAVDKSDQAMVVKLGTIFNLHVVSRLSRVVKVVLAAVEAANSGRNGGNGIGNDGNDGGNYGSAARGNFQFHPFAKSRQTPPSKYRESVRREKNLGINSV